MDKNKEKSFEMTYEDLHIMQNLIKHLALRTSRQICKYVKISALNV